MKKSRFKFVLWAMFCLLIISIVNAQDIKKVEIEKGKYQKIVVSNFTKQKDVEKLTDASVSVMMAEIVKELTKLAKFKEVSLENDSKKESDNTSENKGDAKNQVNNSTLRLEGVIVKFDEGDRATRYIIGMGAGKTKIVARIKFIDANNNVLLEKEVDGSVVLGVFGGSSSGATRGLAKDVAKLAKKTFF
jgi:hypothetical protein